LNRKVATHPDVARTAPISRRRLLEALIASLPLVLFFLYFSPLARTFSGASRAPQSLISDTSSASRDPISVSSGYEQTFGATTRICRYRGTEWEVTIQSVAMPAAGAMEKALSSPQFRLVPLDPTADGPPTEAILKSAVQLGRLAAGESVAASEPKALLAGKTPTGPPLAILVSFPADDGRTVLVTMKMPDRYQLVNLVTPPDLVALRAELEGFIPLLPAAELLDKIENETTREITTNYILAQAVPEWEAAEFYEKKIAGLETVAEGDLSRVVFQVVRRGNVTVYLAHYPGEAAGSSQTLVKVWRKTPSA